MKKNSLGLFIAMLFVYINNVSSQDLIAVQNGNTPTFYEDLEIAITNAVAGDTLYIPGRSYAITNPINKKLHLVGVGHHPDSTAATNRTVITGILKLDIGSDYGSLHGIYFPSRSNQYASAVSIEVKEKVVGYSISNCYLVYGIGVVENGYPQSFVIKHNIISKIQFGFDVGTNNNILNNIITNTRTTISYSVIKNNIFLANYNSYDSSYGLRSVDCLIENNIFNTSSLSYTNLNNNIIRNNLNGGLNGVDSFGNQGSGNFLDGLLLSIVFESYIDDSYDYNSDLHLKVDSPYKNAGRDGTDIGIYGGAFPWKEGSIPFNPHIQISQIAPATDINGNLKVKIQVQAQEH